MNIQFLKNIFSNLTPTSNTPTCCCNSADNCNYPGYVAPSPPERTYRRRFCVIKATVIFHITTDTTMFCYGDCGVVILESSVDAVNASFSSCDPVSACQTANTMNNCSKTYVNGLDASITSCCCNTDRCNTPGLLYPQPTAIRCFAGFGVRS